GRRSTRPGSRRDGRSVRKLATASNGSKSPKRSGTVDDRPWLVDNGTWRQRAVGRLEVGSMPFRLVPQRRQDPERPIEASLGKKAAGRVLRIDNQRPAARPRDQT